MAMLYVASWMHCVIWRLQRQSSAFSRLHILQRRMCPGLIRLLLPQWLVLSHKGINADNGQH